jgi:hypothetical protein
MIIDAIIPLVSGDMKKQDSDSTAEGPADHDNDRVIRAFGQEAHVLVSSEQTGDAFWVLQFFIAPGYHIL